MSKRLERPQARRPGSTHRQLGFLGCLAIISICLIASSVFASDPCHDSDGDGWADPAVASDSCPPDNCPAISNPDQDDCTHNGDPIEDGVIDVLDVVRVIDVAFRGGTPMADSNCGVALPEDTDLNCDDATDVVDAVRVVDVAFRGASASFCKPCECDCYPTSCPETSGMANLLSNHGSFERHCQGTLDGWQFESWSQNVEVVSAGAPQGGDWSLLLRTCWVCAGRVSTQITNPEAGGIYRLSTYFKPYGPYHWFEGAAGIAWLEYGAHRKYLFPWSDSLWAYFEVTDTLPTDQSGPLGIWLSGDVGQFGNDGVFDRVTLEYLGQAGP